MKKLVLGLLVLMTLLFFGCSGMKNGAIQQWISKNPNDAATLNNIGSNHYERGQYQEAIDYYDLPN
jgi:Tfp pilus assembly protein PilF